MSSAVDGDLINRNSSQMDANNSDMEYIKLPHIPITTSVGCCFAMSVMYVASLYVWSSKHSRDHPTTIKRRFCSVAIVMCITPFFVYKFSSTELMERISFLDLIGLRCAGLWQAIVIPYLLTVLLFLGPLWVQIQNETLRMYLDTNYWHNQLGNIIWLRNHIVAPLSEEFVFRACMMPLILQSFSPKMSVFITPLFFGVAHMHHIAERVSLGVDLATALLIALFQFAYTTLFGFYSSFLFARTGHLVAPFLVHAFCNHMGLPDLQDLWQRPLKSRIIAISIYVIGFGCWVLLLPYATNPALYKNRLYWNI